MRTQFKQAAGVYMTLLLAACQTPQTVQPAQLVQHIVEADASLQATAPAAQASTTLSEYDAVMLALQQNPAFKAQLSELNLANADVQQANQLANPSLFYAFSAANKPYRYAIDFPIEAILLRPIRLKQMQAQAQATQYQLMQSGFSLIRDTRMAYAQAVIANEKRERLKQALQLNQTIASLTSTREQLGDISAQDTLLSQNEALLAARDLQLAEMDAQLAHTQLMHLLGWMDENKTLSLSEQLVPACTPVDIAQLKTVALSSRPDILAAEANMAAAKAKQQLNKFNWLGTAVVADATSGQTSGHVLAPAIRTTLPVFNQNQGQRQRADVELEKAQQDAEAIKIKASLEINSAHLKYQRDCQEWQQLHTQLQPNAKQTIQYAEDAYRDGDIAYLNVLESSKRYFSLQLRETQLKADLIGNWSDLMRSTSHATARP
ncbi:TolC family protein [Methylophilus sp. 5]|uniref:TolC family protein n=1 Tax=Methylophilus sp. 5 TaxID=1112274 RepID=UPI00048B7892|nr:TolC family protein [Methylophilus sp. 5]